MKKNSNKSIQELILNFLMRKKAVKSDDLVSEVEILIKNQGSEGKSKPKYMVNRALKQMIDNDILTERSTEQSSFLSLSSSGRHKLRSIKLSSKNHLVSTSWDGYWRIVILDVPESKKSTRDAIRYILKKAQFVQLKSSIWISPFELEHMMINIKNDLDLHEELIVLVTNKLDEQTEVLLKDKFTKSEE